MLKLRSEIEICAMQRTCIINHGLQLGRLDGDCARHKVDAIFLAS